MTPEQLFLRETAAVHIFSDVFTLLKDENGIPTDFDAELTTYYRLLLIKGLRTVHAIGDSQLLAAYGIELVANLIDTAKIAVAQGLETSQSPHPDLLTAQDTLESEAIRITANIAQRSERTSQTNGTHFYLAILDNGLEIYATPISLLQYVADRVVALFEIPNQGHPLFDGKTEQFRSSVVGRTYQTPEHLVRVPITNETIPSQKHNLQVAYVDKFGNIRLREKGVQKQRVLAEHDKLKTCTLIIGNQELTKVHLVTCLNDIPQGKWGLYRNSADKGVGNGDTHGAYWELIYKDYELTQLGGSWALLENPDLGTPIQAVFES